MQVGLDVQLLADMQQAIAALEPRAAPKNSDPQPTQDALYQVLELLSVPHVCRLGKDGFAGAMAPFPILSYCSLVGGSLCSMVWGSLQHGIEVRASFPLQAFKKGLDLLIVDLERNVKLLGTPERAQVGSFDHDCALLFLLSLILLSVSSAFCSL